MYEECMRASSTHPASLNDNPGLGITGNFQISQNKHQKKYNKPEKHTGLNTILNSLLHIDRTSQNRKKTLASFVRHDKQIPCLTLLSLLIGWINSCFLWEVQAQQLPTPFCCSRTLTTVSTAPSGFGCDAPEQNTTSFQKETYFLVGSLFEHLWSTV